jgi:signal transduction histidine kinase
MSRLAFYGLCLPAVAVAYLAAGQIGLLLPIAGGNVSLVWVPGGLALAAVLLLGFRVWPALAIGAFAAAATTGNLTLACFTAAGNTAEALLGAWLLHRLVNFDPRLQRVSDAVGFLSLACVVAPAAGAAVGAAGLLASGTVGDVGSAADAAFFWWLGDGVGVLLVAPVFLTWASRPLPVTGAGRSGEAAGLLASLVLVASLVFSGILDRALSTAPAAFAVFPFLVWASLRFGPRLAATASLIAATLAVLGTVRGHGPFAGADLTGGLALLYGYIIQAVGLSLLLAATLAERRKALEAVRESDRRKDEFIALLDHELRNPLAPVRTTLRSLRLARYDPAAVAPACGMMERQVEYVVRLLDGLLDVSRLVRGRFELFPAPVQLAEVVRSAVEQTRARLDGSGHRLVLRVAPDPVWLFADATRLTQAVANLLDNAARYTEPGGEVTLEACRDGDDAVVQVRDTGIGLSPEVLPRLFVPFAQFARERFRTEGGLGVGLALVRSVAELHGGSATAHSDGPGKGSTFTLRLPALPAGPDSGPRPAVRRGDTPADGTPLPVRRVLIVEDNGPAAEALAGFLRLVGYEVVVAPDGEAGLGKANEWHPDAVVCDIGLPGMDGYDVARELRRQPVGPRLLLAVTGYSQPEDRRRALEAGFDRHFTKPVDPEAVAACLARPPRRREAGA